MLIYSVSQFNRNRQSTPNLSYCLGIMMFTLFAFIVKTRVKRQNRFKMKMVSETFLPPLFFYIKLIDREYLLLQKCLAKQDQQISQCVWNCQFNPCKSDFNRQFIFTNFCIFCY